MTFRIRQISETADGREIIRVAEATSSAISIGRSTDCDVHLPDLAVEPLQAKAETRGDGFVAISSTGTLGFSVDGRVTTSARIDAAKGAEVGFGSHRITLSRDTDGAIVLTVRRVEAISESAGELGSDRSFSLSSALPGKRVMAWGFFACILLAFLIVPVLSNLTRGTQADAKVTMDASWSPGALSAAHHALEKNCTACHVKPFESVRDKACLACHKDTHDHAPIARLDEGRPEPGLGGKFLWAAAHGFGKPGPGACVDCHREHDDGRDMPPVKQAFCADCHATLNDRLTDTALGDASDFGKAHPEFRALVATDLAAKPHFERISLADKPIDKNGLAFNHEVHLKASGTVARMAIDLGKSRGYGQALDCSNCHTPTADGVRFKPIDMERDCEACHSLAYDKFGGTVRRLHHGDFAQMVADLRAAEGGPSKPVGTGLSARDRPGTHEDDALYRANFGRPRMHNLALMQAVSDTGVCGECHTIQKHGDNIASWSVAPVHLTQRYFLNGWFDHRAHNQQKCSDCHAADTSTKASDLLLPNIKECRSCHLGETSTKAKVPSSCVMCHDYHPGEGAPWFTTRERGHKTLFMTRTDPITEPGRPGDTQ